MTKEVVAPGGGFTVSGTGPYAVDWPYATGAVQAVAIVAGVRHPLVAGTDFTVSPTASDTTGDLTLSGAAAALYAGAQLNLSRSTPAEQGWQGFGAREVGLGAQLDLLTMIAQELLQIAGRTIRMESDAAPFVAEAGRAIIFDAFLNPTVGPNAADIADAQMNAAAALASQIAAAASEANIALLAAQAQAAAGALGYSSRAITTSQTLTIADAGSLLVVSAAAGNVTLTLPTVASMGTTKGPIWIIRSDTSANSLSIDGAGAETVAGSAAVYPIVARKAVHMFRSDGAGWQVAVPTGGKAQSNLTEFMDHTGAETLLRMTANGAVEAFFDNTKRAETTAAGFDVTGTLNVSGAASAASLAVTGVVTEGARSAEAWHVVARSAGVFYQNTTGRLIRVAALNESSLTVGAMSLSVSPTATSNVISMITIPGNGIGWRGTVYGDVPPGHYYRIDVSGGVTLLQVEELS